MIAEQDLGGSGTLALSYARRAATELGSSAIGTEHLFLGVAELEDVKIRRRFSDVGVDLEEICAEVKKAAGSASGGSGGEPTFSPAADAALEVAKQEVAALGQELVEAPHILIGVLHDSDGITATTLTGAGGDVSALEERLEAMLQGKDWSPDFYEQRKAIQQPEISKTSTVLESLGRDLTEAAERGELHDAIGRDREILELCNVLLARRKNNAVLIGDAGVGKTAIAEALAVRIQEGRVPKELQGMRIRTIEVGSLVAGTIYRGQFEERLKALVDEVRGRTDVILFIDEIHMLIGAGEVGGGTMDAANILKPVLGEGKLKVIGATTTAEYRKYFEKDEALKRRFQAVLVPEPSREATLVILESMRPKYEEFHDLQILDEALQAAVDLSVRYVQDRNLPDKAFDLLDRACTQKKLAASMREWLPALAAAPPEEGPPAETEGRLVVSAEDIAEVVSVMLEIPIARLTADERERLLTMAETLKSRVVGQDRAVDAIADTVIRVRTGFEKPDRPYGVFLFCGPTGVGKTKLAQEVAAFLFGGKDELIRLDMSEFMEHHTVSGLIGSPPGYIGHEEGGRLTNAVRAKPYAIVLLDEVEKAHPDVWQLFLQVFDEGRLTDAHGRLVDFRNTLIVMTSNVGARQIQSTSTLGFFPTTVGGEQQEPSYGDIKREVEKELKRTFAPEFLNRIDEVVVFEPLSREDLRAIIGFLLREMVPLRLDLSEEAFDLLVEASYEPTMGARPARRAIQKLLSNPLSLMMARGEIGEDDTVAVGLEDGVFTFAKAAVEEAAAV